MNYKTRLLESKLKKSAQYFPVIVLVGARQVGKTTLLKHLLPNVQCITFDPVIDIGNARADPDFFLDQLNTPVLLDEIQYAPELLSAIKRRVDHSQKPGQYWLTGSQNLSLLKSVSESLAGRAALFTLYPLSLGELYDEPSTWINRFLTDPEIFLHESQERFHIEENGSLLQILWRGGYPGLSMLDPEFLQVALDSYFKTYVERDIRLLAEVSNFQLFSRFVQLIAHLTSQEIFSSQLGRELNISPKTAQRWLNILVSTYQWTELPAFSGNGIKRISGKNKGYFMDTGMVCHLLQMSSPGALLGFPRLGALFETWVVQDLLKQLDMMSTKPDKYHWRTHAGAEVDLILEWNNRYFPIEIKCKTQITKRDVSGIKAFRSSYPELDMAPALIIAPVKTIQKIDYDVYVIPFDLK